MHIISRAQAAKRGLKRYYTGKTCKFGHDSERYLNGGMCVKCVALKTARNEAAARDALGHRAYNRQRHLRLKYGVTVMEYEKLLAAQGNRCACCAAPFNHTKAWSVCIDHSHITGAVRGILCHRCNKALGFIGDNPETAHALATYLRREPLSLTGHPWKDKTEEPSCPL